MSRVLIAASGLPGSLGLYVTDIAAARGHDVARLTTLDDGPALREQLAGAAAVVLVPKRGDQHRHAHQATRALVTAARDLRSQPHLLLLSSFAVGHGPSHPLNRIDDALLPGRIAAERTLRSSGLPYTIVRPTWFTSDPPGEYAITLTQHERTDGMVSRADLATVLVSAIEHPAARGTTFSVFNEPGEPPAAWADSFARLRPDPHPGGHHLEDPA